MQKRKITIKSGGEEFQMEVTVEECRIYYRPWWQKKEQRNREAMEENEYMMSLMRGERWPAGRIPGQFNTERKGTGGETNWRAGFGQ